MITFKDALSLNLRRTGKKKRSGGKKSLAALFTFLFFLICLINGGYGVIAKIVEIFYKTDYHNPNVIMVKADYQNRRFIRPEDLDAVSKLEGVELVQGKLHVSKGHIFLMDRINYIQPETLFGYKDELFKTYCLLPSQNRNPKAIPILLSQNLFNLSYVRDENVFIRRKKEETDLYLGRTFTIIIDPFCGQDYFGWNFFEPDKAYDPVMFFRRAASQQKMVLEYLTKTKPGVVKYCDPLPLKFQIAGYIQDSGGANNPLSAYGVIPLSQARRISQITQLRRESVNQHEDEFRHPKSGKLSSAYVLCKTGFKDSISRSIEKTGLVVERQAVSPNRMITEIIDELKKNTGLIYFGVIILLPFVFFIILSIYKILSVNVKDSIKEIGVMRCIGATRKDIRRMFNQLCFYEVLQVLILSLIAANGTMLAIGFFTAGAFNRIPLKMVHSEIFILISAVGDFSVAWLTAPAWIQILPLIPLIPITFTAAYLPVRKASKVDPVVAMKI